MKTRFVLFVAGFFLLAGCSVQGPDAPENVYFIEELGTWEFSLRDGYTALVEALDMDAEDPTVQKIFDFINPLLEHRIKGVAISYHTRDPYGNPIVSAGSFFYPLDNTPKGVVEVPPIAHTDAYHSPSLSIQEKDFFEEAIPALFEYITINQDQIGGNLTGHEYLRPFLQTESVGRTSLDMRKAVAEYLKEKENMELPSQTMVMGYSLGGSSALAVAKYYVENEPDITVTEVFTGGGVYDAPTAFKAYAKIGTCPYPAIPYVIVSMNVYYHLNLDFTKIFVGGMQNAVNTPLASDGGDGYAYWFDNTHNSYRIAERWGSDLHAFLHEDFFNEQLVGEFAKLKDCLEENSLVYHFDPPTYMDIKLLHSAEDNLIPVVSADLLYDVYKTKGANISFIRTTGDHYQAGAEFMATVALYLAAK